MGLGTGEIIIILIIVLIVFGAGRLPAIGDGLGRAIKNFKRSMSGRDEINVTPRPKVDPPPPAEPKG
jgi:sec-independent protein translocase protein TatA